MIAVPIDAPPCRMMFIAVLVRAIAAGGTACIAAVIVGIIARPMPRPSTTLKLSSSAYGVCAVTNANGSHTDHQQRDPGCGQLVAGRSGRSGGRRSAS